METTARLLRVETSPGSGSACNSTTTGPARVMGMSMPVPWPTGTAWTCGGSPSRRMVRRAIVVAGRHAEIVDSEAYGDGAADEAEARGLDDADPAIGLLAFRRDQHLEWSGKRRGGGVVDLAVGQGEDAGEAGAGDVGQGRGR